VITQTRRQPRTVIVTLPRVIGEKENDAEWSATLLPRDAL